MIDSGAETSENLVVGRVDGTGRLTSQCNKDLSVAIKELGIFLPLGPDGLLQIEECLIFCLGQVIGGCVTGHSDVHADLTASVSIEWWKHNVESLLLQVLVSSPQLRRLADGNFLLWSQVDTATRFEHHIEQLVVSRAECSLSLAIVQMDRSASDGLGSKGLHAYAFQKRIDFKLIVDR